MLCGAGATARNAVKRATARVITRLHSHAVWEHRVEEPAAGTLPVPAACGKDLQPAPGYPSRAHQSGNAVPGSEWSSLLPYQVGCDLLHDVLPVNEKLSAVTMRNHLLEVAERMEQELGEERPCLMEGCEQDGEQLPIPDGPLTVGLDGGFVRARHKPGCLR